MRSPLKRKQPRRIRGVEHLEVRALPSGVALIAASGHTVESEPNETLDRANNLGSPVALTVDGSIDQGGVDVDWYEFTLDAPSTVSLTSTSGTLSLFNGSAEYTDPLDQGRHRLLDQSTAGETEPARVLRDLAAGTYYVAVSGGGNRYFHPLVAGSGLAGETGPYTLDISTSPFDTSASNGPLVLSVSASPLVARIDLTAALSFTPTVELFDSAGRSVPVARIIQSFSLSELQVFPAAPLVPGDYHALVKDTAGNVLFAVDFSMPVVAGSETGIAGNDTPATSIDLGNLDEQGLVQFVGAIGDDPSYQFDLSGPLSYAGNDVDLYHFQISSTETIGLQAEVFAGRIGSPLDAGVSLFKLDPVTGHLVYVTGNNNTYNLTRANDGTSPFYYDSAITAGLTAGDYYLAVTNGMNAVSPDEGQGPGARSGFFDPEQSHSASSGMTIGPYVVNLQVVAVPDPPQVVQASITQDSVLPAAPTEFTVKFTEFISFTSLAFATYQQTSESTMAGVFVSDEQGNSYFPRLQAYDTNNLQASFMMLDRLDPGNYELHLSGSHGLTNIVGHPLVGNSTDGDYVVQFSVAGTAAGTAGNPLVWTHETESETTATTQSIGILFPNELHAGVAIVRHPGSKSGQVRDSSDDYQFQILQTQGYYFHLDGNNLPNHVQLELIDQAGNVVLASVREDGLTLIAQLKPGQYVLHVGDWSGSAARGLDYQIDIALLGKSDNPTPLWSGPAPTVGIRLVSDAIPNIGGGATTVGGTSGGGGSFAGGQTILGGSTGGASTGSGASGTSGASGASGGTQTSASSLTGLNRERYFSERLGASLFSLPGGPDSVIVAIPTVTSSLGTRSGSVINAARSITRGANPRARLSLSGLSDLADGPMGKSGSGSADRSLRHLASHRLRDLIQSDLASRKVQETDPKDSSDNSNTASKPATDSDRNVAPEDTEAVTENEQVPDDSENDSVSQEARQPQPDKVSQIDAGHIDFGEDLSLFAINQESAESPLSSSDNLFAGGLGMLLSALMVSQSTPNQAPPKWVNRPNRKWHPLLK